mmetsp:Transcript_4484/g.12477  ORF Transcript_4484/g.12477 Transcript_4484/m.12477 type:complete len:80 (-) Transcript_4484:201-440(-)
MVLLIVVGVHDVQRRTAARILASPLLSGMIVLSILGNISGSPVMPIQPVVHGAESTFIVSESASNGLLSTCYAVEMVRL